MCDPFELSFKRNNVSGTFAPGEIVVQSNSGARAMYLSDDETYFHLRYLGGTWNATDSITGQSSHQTAQANGQTTADLNGLFVSLTSYTYNQTQNLGVVVQGTDTYDQIQSYDTVTDAMGHETRTYRDGAGRERETLYADNSYTATYYSADDYPGEEPQVSSPDDWNASDGSWDLTAADGWTWTAWWGGAAVPAGYQEVVKVAQRKRNQDNGGNHDPVLATIYLYDPAGRLVDVWLPAVADALNSNTMTRPHWHYEYDANGNEIEQVDPKGNVTTWTYDDNGNQTSRTLPAVDGVTVSESWTYDDFGRMKTHTDFDWQTTAYRYDDTPAYGGRLLHEYRYDSSHTPTFAGDGTLQNPNDAAERTDYTYDDLGRQQTAADLTNTPGTNAWQARTSTTDTYDPITGQAASTETTIAGDSLGMVHYAYDPATGRKIETYTDHNDTSYLYNDLGELWKVHVTTLNDTAVDQWTIYTYDAVGDLQTVTQPDGMTTTYTYDSLNRLTDETVTRDDLSTPNVVETTPVMEFEYTLRDDGLRDDVTETRYSSDGSSIFSQTFIDYGYDADGRLTDESLTVLQAGGNAPTPYADHYTFDLSGNRRQKVIDAGNNGTTDETITYSCNERDQLITEDSTIDANQRHLPLRSQWLDDGEGDRGRGLHHDHALSLGPAQPHGGGRRQWRRSDHRLRGPDHRDGQRHFRCDLQLRHQRRAHQRDPRRRHDDLLPDRPAEPDGLRQADRGEAGIVTRNGDALPLVRAGLEGGRTERCCQWDAVPSNRWSRQHAGPG